MSASQTKTRKSIDQATSSQLATELEVMRRRLTFWLVELQPRLIPLDASKIHRALDTIARLNVAFDSRFIRDQATPLASPFSSDQTRAAGERLANLLASEAANSNSHHPDPKP